MKQLSFSIAPFIGFIFGHLLVWHMQRPKVLPCPSLKGKSLLDACIEATKNTVNIKVTRIVISEATPQNTVVAQHPKEHSPIKEQQSIYVTVSIPPSPHYAPYILGKKSDEIKSNPDYKLITLHPIPPSISKSPPATIFAQYPAAEEPITNGKMKAYVSQHESDPFYIMPNCIGHYLDDVIELFTLNQIPYTCNNTVHKNRIIKNQSPVAGTLVNKNNLKMIYLDC